MRIKERAIARDEQVYICFDGPNGQVMQTSMATYAGYYRLLGWELLGRVRKLIEDRDLRPQKVAG